MNYLIDVIPTKEDYCPDGYETKVIGKWSGFNGGCYCSNNQTGIQIATDEKCNDILNDIFTCYPLIDTPPVDLIRYKGFQFCVKRSNDNYMGLFGKVDEIYAEGVYDHSFENNKNNYKQYKQNKQNKNISDINSSSYSYRDKNEVESFFYDSKTKKVDYEKYSDYIKILISSAPPNYLDPNAIIDLKILNTKTFNATEISNYYHNLSNYEEHKINNTDFSLFTLRLRSLNRPQNILDLQKVLVDIHLYNELWCAYLDLSSTYLKFKFSKEDINYGDIEHCENFYLNKNSSLTFNDNFVNSISLNFDFDNSASLFDFYDFNGITEFYNRLKTRDPSNNPNLIKNSMYGNFEPIMTAQKYFMGIGCLYSKEPLEHLKALKVPFTLVRLSGAIAVLLTIGGFIGFVYACAKGKDNCGKFRVNAMFLLFVLMLICVLVSLSVDLLARQTLLYLQDYMIYCQTDFTNNQDNNALKVSAMENNFFELLLYVYKVSGSTSSSLFFGCLMLFVYLCSECRKKRAFDANSVAGNNIGINQFEVNGMNYNNNNNNVSNTANANRPKEIEITVIENYNSNNSDKFKKQVIAEKPVDNSSFAGNKIINNTPQGNFGYSNNFDHTGFQFSEGDASKKCPAALSNREAAVGSIDVSGITDRSNINLNNFNK
jgi:hypothetical protein